VVGRDRLSWTPRIRLDRSALRSPPAESGGSRTADASRSGPPSSCSRPVRPRPESPDSSGVPTSRCQPGQPGQGGQVTYPDTGAAFGRGTPTSSSRSTTRGGTPLNRVVVACGGPGPAAPGLAGTRRSHLGRAATPAGGSSAADLSTTCSGRHARHPRPVPSIEPVTSASTSTWPSRTTDLLCRAAGSVGPRTVSAVATATPGRDRPPATGPRGSSPLRAPRLAAAGRTRRPRLRSTTAGPCGSPTPQGNDVRRRRHAPRRTYFYVVTAVDRSSAPTIRFPPEASTNLPEAVVVLIRVSMLPSRLLRLRD
jgi:hypothetical protein